ncbi:hypothetical protein KO498_00265 [Lentibacter algarum]|uniref:hypothetical protein n=1 Tax=Lentibacter algarum TaxID=576131 RepID=UPI001C07EE86|nr:hypothetical protein [Lentibacter algarum]MBU2980231.1 hypothetical protein [Lentibacter algarum]
MKKLDRWDSGAHMNFLRLVVLSSFAMLVATAGHSGSLEYPTSFRDCNYVPLKHALIKQQSQKYSACFNKLAKISTSSPGWRNEKVSCGGGWPRACVQYMHKSCEIRAKFERKQALCRIKMNRALAEHRREVAAQKEFQRQQREQQRRAEEAERQRRANARRQMAQIHKYKDSAIVSSHLAGRMGGLTQPPLGGSYYLSQTLSAAGTRYVTNTMADAVLQLERAVYGPPKGNQTRFVQGGYSATNPRMPLSAQIQAHNLYGSLHAQANRTATTTYQLPIENMSVQSSIVTGVLTLIVQQQLDGVSPDLQSALTSFIATGVAALIDGKELGPSTDDRRRNVFGLLEADQKKREAEQAKKPTSRRRLKNYNYCMKTKVLSGSGTRYTIRGTNTCKFTLRCSIEQYKNSKRRFVRLKSGQSMIRQLSSKRQYWHGCHR